MSLYYHGTNHMNALQIQKEGFRPGTWFADRKEDAVKFGGKHVFSVAIRWLGQRAYDWQICAVNAISKARIMKYGVIKGEAP